MIISKCQNKKLKYLPSLNARFRGALLIGFKSKRRVISPGGINDCINLITRVPCIITTVNSNYVIWFYIEQLTNLF